MRTKLISACLAVIALAFAYAPQAVAAPAKKSVTYSLSLKSGGGDNSVVYFVGKSGKTWNIVTAPWTKSVQLDVSATPTMHVTSRTSTGRYPVYVCSIYVNGTLKTQKESYGGVKCMPGI